MDIKRKPDSEPAANSSQSCILNLKLWKYDELYWFIGVLFGYTSVVVISEEPPQCVLCLSILIAESMKPDKLKQHLETKRSQIKKSLKNI